MGVIYLRTNLINGMKYVGQTIDLKKRERAWKCLKLKYANQLLTDDRNKYGLENWDLTILKECDDSELDEFENYYIREYNTVYPNGYNDNEGGSIGFHLSDRTKEKISKANSKENNGMYCKIPWNKGKQWSEAIKEKLSKSHIGNTSALGHTVSNDARKKISESKKGVPNLKLAKKVIQVTENGSIIEWDSIAECKRNGFNGIDRVCRGERPQAYRCKWYYKDEYLKMLAEQNC